MSALVECDGLVHIYKSDGLEVVALQGLDLHVNEGEAIALVGRSGSGKTTLMNVLAAMETPSAGRVRVAGFDLTQLSEPQRDHYRRHLVGYVWQQAQLHVVPDLTVLENVQLPLVGAGCPGRERRARASRLVSALGLSERLYHRPAQLAGGEQQRLALAVAMANHPRLLLADEPTAELDDATAQAVLSDLRSVQQELGTTLIMVTHDVQVERFVERVIRIRDGRTSTETRWVESAGTVVADEVIILDRAGRLQLPRAYVEALRLKDRVRVRLAADHVRVLPMNAEGQDSRAEGATDA